MAVTLVVPGNGGGGGIGPSDDITVTPPTAGGVTQPDGSIGYDGDKEVTFTAAYTGDGAPLLYMNGLQLVQLQLQVELTLPLPR